MVRAVRAAPLLLLAGCVGAFGPGASPAAAPPPSDAEALAVQYREFLDRGRTASRAVRHAAERAPGFRRVDPLTDEPRAAPGDRLLFVDRDHTAVFVTVGKRKLATHGARLLASHVDTPAPRLDTTHLTRDNQTRLVAHRYGGIKSFHWLHRPLAAVGQVAMRGGRVVDVDLSDVWFWGEEVLPSGDIAVTASTTPTADPAAGPAATFVGELHRRYGLDAADLVAAELYLVPREPAREVGLDRSLIGAHGQDDRANSFIAWRAALDVPAPPEHTAVVWLLDREEQGSSGPTGAASRFLELVYAWLLRAEGGPASEAALHRALAATVTLSADTPACLEANWPEVHEMSAAPRLGRGPALFPFTGRGGKEGGSAARAELVASVFASFRRSGAAIQTGELGKVDEGGGGTIANDFAQRGMDVVDIGVCVASLHSPLELTAKADLWAAYRGFRAWLAE
jgi:aspartyl aminopeptidase